MLARRIAAGVIAALAVVLFATFTQDAHAGVQWVTKQIGWASTQPGAGIALSSGGLDTCLITDEADSNRTVVINTSDWAWDALLPAAATSAANPAAIITVTGQKVNAAAESLYVLVDKCFKGTCARSVLAAGTWVAGVNILGLSPFGMTGPTWGTWATGSATYTKSSAPAVMYQGTLKIDLDEDKTAGSSSVFGAPEIRFNVIGDISGTTPQLNAARIYLTYPKLVQP